MQRQECAQEGPDGPTLRRTLGHGGGLGREGICAGAVHPRRVRQAGRDLQRGPGGAEGVPPADRPGPGVGAVDQGPQEQAAGGAQGGLQSHHPGDAEEDHGGVDGAKRAGDPHEHQARDEEVVCQLRRDGEGRGRRGVGMQSAPSDMHRGAGGCKDPAVPELRPGVGRWPNLPHAP